MYFNLQNKEYLSSYSYNFCYKIKQIYLKKLQTYIPIFEFKVFVVFMVKLYDTLLILCNQCPVAKPGYVSTAVVACSMKEGIGGRKKTLISVTLHA